MNGIEPSIHQPVLIEEVVRWLGIEREGLPRRFALLDCTLGGGGHVKRLLASDQRFVAAVLDQDPSAVQRAQIALGNEVNRLCFMIGNFAELKTILAGYRTRLAGLGVAFDRQGAPQFDRILVDLGISSDQLDAAERGFSFAKEGALDMRMNPGTLLTADEIVNKWPAGRLLAVLREGGVGAGASAFVREIVKKRPVRSTLELAEICRKASVAQRRRAGKTGPVKKQHPATVVFQALRIAVNQELQSLSSFLAQVLAVLAPGGRLAMISFHSLEDQLVARAMRAWSQPPVEVRNLPQSGLLSVPGELLTKKAVVPQAAEVAANVRARSARMRVFERFGAVCPVEGV